MNRPRGVAYPLYRRVVNEMLTKGLSQQDLHRDTGLAVSTFLNLQHGRRRPFPRTVFALADWLGIPRDEAAELAGLVPPEVAQPATRSAPVRDAIAHSDAFNADQRAMLLNMIDLIDQANAGQAPREVDPGVTESGG